MSDTAFERAGRPRLAVVTSHPVQNQAPWFRALADRVDLQVLFAHRISAADHRRSGYGVGFEWDVPLLEGYRFEWLRNVARRPGVDHFLGCNTPDVGARLAAGRFDAVVVIGWNLLTFWQTIRAAKRIGVPVMVRGDAQPLPASGSARAVIKDAVYPRLLGAFDMCLCVGRRNLEYYQHYGVPPQRLGRSPHCVDNLFFARTAREAAADPAALRRALGLPASPVIFLFAGRLIDLKRPLDFLQALDRLRRDGLDVHGLVVGDGPLRRALESHQARRGTPCTFAGFLNQSAIGRAYAAADALVLPSSVEPWGLVVNEAMASGVPAIVSDRIGCAPDLVVDGVTGYTYPCGEVDRLADRMRRLTEDAASRAAMRAAVLERIQSYSPEAAAEGVVAAMHALRARCAAA
jgi:glycosyltransferase involved in cell wall biosynthesis